MRHVLVANRGEIAVRLLRAARAAGYATTAVYSEADVGAPHVRLADHAVGLGPPAAVESYLVIDRILAAAAATGADAIHPGYGMLAENAAFAEACTTAGLTFIGPRAETIALMADKGRARGAAIAAGVPCVPGYDGDDQTLQTLGAQARRIGLPLMVKAKAGGGGRGMRRVAAEQALAEALTRARSEAESAFGDGRLMLERAIEGGRHIEIQVIGDMHGHVVHLGERDCSVQRRYQKLIEESPSPAVDAPLRERLGDAALALARACQYHGVGTVEFLLGNDGQFYFLEMNTRLQVEHAVTEAVTGLDLVQLQFDVAEGRALPFEQADVCFQGHAVEARLCAEDPRADFMPQTGRVLHFAAPPAALARTDHALEDGQLISPHYDSMVAKVIASGQDRADAVRRLDRALAELLLFGLRHNRDYLRAVLAHPEFATGAATTAFVATQAEALRGNDGPGMKLWALSAFIIAEHPARAAGYGALCGFSNNAQMSAIVALKIGDERAELSVVRTRRPARWTVVREAEVVTLQAPSWSEDGLSVVLDGVREKIRFVLEGGGTLWLDADGGAFMAVDCTHAPSQSASEAGTGELTSSIEATVVQVDVDVGAAVTRGQVLLVLEAMKLQHQVLADMDGRVGALHVTAGEQVSIGQPLVVLVEDAPPG